MIESLIRAGAMDSLEGSRSQLMAALDSAMEHGQSAWRDRLSGQAGLFASMFEPGERHEPELPRAPDWTAREKLSGEKDMLGFYVTGHPLDEYSEKVRELASHDSETVEGLTRGVEVKLCGILTGIQRKRNKEGKPWASMQIEDRKGSLEAMLFASQYEANLQFLAEDRAVMVRGSILPEESGPPKVSMQEIIPLELVRMPFPSLISIRVVVGRANGGNPADELTRLFGRKPGETEVRLRLEKPRDFSMILDLDAKVRPDREFRSEIERICGPESLEVLAG
jgi:DNA polymerase-3 subunit alpha